MAFALTPEDHIFGSHRSHGEILAKAFSAIRQMDDERLLGNHARLPRRRHPRGRSEDGFDGAVQGLARRFFVYGAYSEIFARETGLQPRPGRLHARLLHALRHLSQ